MGLYDQPYTDPMRDLIGALERNTELTVGSAGTFYEHLDQFEGPLSKALSALESSIENLEIRPALPEALHLEPPAAAHVSELPGPRSPNPPAPEESGTTAHAGLKPPPAAMPFFTRGGLAPLSFRPRLGGSTGIKAQGPSTEARWCLRDDCSRDISECRECGEWDEETQTCRYEERAAESEDTRDGEA